MRMRRSTAVNCCSSRGRQDAIRVIINGSVRPLDWSVLKTLSGGTVELIATSQGEAHYEVAVTCCSLLYRACQFRLIRDEGLIIIR
jgi:hypothetical protein